MNHVIDALSIPELNAASEKVPLPVRILIACKISYSIMNYISFFTIVSLKYPCACVGGMLNGNLLAFCFVSLPHARVQVWMHAVWILFGSQSANIL